MSSSLQESVSYEYERSIQLLQEEVYSLRREINVQGRTEAGGSEVVYDMEQKLEQAG